MIGVDAEYRGSNMAPLAWLQELGLKARGDQEEIVTSALARPSPSVIRHEMRSTALHVQSQHHPLALFRGWAGFLSHTMRVCCAFAQIEGMVDRSHARGFIVVDSPRLDCAL